MADQIAEQFEFWLNNLTDSIQEVSGLINAVPINREELSDAVSGLDIGLNKVQSFQPINKTKVSYEFKTALPRVASALRLQAKAQRLLGDNVESNTSSKQTTNTIHRKIPEVPIPIFTGNYDAYQSFITAFHLKFDPLPIPSAEKLRHLQSSVTSEPFQIIGRFELKDENYAVALNILNEKYDKPDRVISEVYHKITALRRAVNNPTSLNEVYHELEGLLVTLTTHGENIDTNPPLRDQVICKYPTHIIHQICGSKMLTVTEFQKEMSNYIAMRTGVQAALAATGTVSEFSDNRPRAATTTLYSTSAKFYKSSTNSNSSPHNSIPICAFCNNRHYSGDCTKVLTLSGRREAIKNRCYMCFSKLHTRNECPKTVVCPLCQKRNSHNRALCPTIFENDCLKTSNSNPTSVTTVPPSNQNSRLINFANASVGAHTTVQITALNPETLRPYPIRALLDNGSNKCYITQQAAKRLGLRSTSFTRLPVKVFGNESPIEIDTSQTMVIITNNDNFRTLVSVDALPHIPQDCTLFDYELFRASYPQHAHLQFAPQAKTEPIELLIGSDYFWHLIKPESKIPISADCFLMNTEFGWILVGQTNKNNSGFTSCLFAQKPKQALDRLCALDSIGINEPPKSVLEEEEAALQQFYKNLKFVNNRYEIRWPWKEFPPNLPNNYGLALGRLKSLQNKLTPELFKSYNEIIEQQLRTGIIEEVPSEKKNISHAHYLPHHAVIKPEKSTTSIRIVYDGSARTAKSKSSLNDTIYKGRNVLADLTAIILRSRFHRILLLADFEKAFHSLQINEHDRDYVRFLWFHELNRPLTPDNIRMLYFTRVAFGIIASPFLLNATIRFHLETNKNEFTDRIKNDIYVDNLCTGVADLEEATQLYEKTFELFQKCSMNLRSWATNSGNLRESFPTEHRDQSDKISILGLLWNQYTDSFRIKPFKSTEESNTLTLRTALSSCASFYDPCGQFSPLTVRTRIFIQKIQLQNVDWDTPVTKELSSEWQDLQNDLVAATKIDYERFIADIDTTSNTYELHAFADASAKACACVFYIRVIPKSKKPSKTYLLFSKARIVKPDIFTIPKLELIAIVFATRIMNFIRTAIPIKYRTQIIWSDSKCALSWIRTHRILPTFIQRRVDEIRTMANVSFRYVSSSDNAADIPSRGATFEEMNNSIWWNGPAWLEAESQWPSEIYDFNELEIDPEWAPLVTIEHMSLPVMRKSYQSPFNLPLENYSSYLSLLRVTKYVVNFLQRVSNNRIPSLHSEKTPLAQAEFIWLKNEQEFHFADVFDAIKQKKRHDLVSKLNLFIDPQGLLRCAHRLRNANLPYAEKFPIILPNIKSSHFVRLLIIYFHELTYHQGTAHTLNVLRREFWILRGRATVSAIVSSCARCKRFRTRPYQQPLDSDIPTLRLQRNVIPFEYIGMDTAGPLYVQHEKRYILLVTDLVIRAVDLELLTEMTTEEISLAFRRVVARRTNPKFILSDNAKQFHLLQSVLSATSRTDLTWKFTPELSPWIGGTYERMIALTKGALWRTFHGQALSDIILRTALVEIAAVLNGRPLTYVSEDMQDKPLTPNHFLRSFLSLPNEIIPDTSRAITRQHLTALWKKGNEITNQFWHQWNTSYLQFLREQHHDTHFPKQVTVHSPQVGTVVLIVDKHLKRAAWQLGRIIRLNYSSDGQVRSVDLKIKNNQIITRPVSLLCPMELPEEENIPFPNPTTQPTTSDARDNTSTFDEIESISCETIDEQDNGSTFDEIEDISRRR